MTVKQEYEGIADCGSTNRAAVSIRGSQFFNNKQEQSSNAGRAEYVMTHDNRTVRR